MPNAPHLRVPKTRHGLRVSLECRAPRLEVFVRRIFSIGLFLSVVCGAASAQKPPLLPEKDVAALAQELSGETAKRNLEGIARFHRQRGSQGFHSVAELVAERARAYGLSGVAILQFPADGKIYYGTQRARPAWDAEFAELWEVKEVIEVKTEKGAHSGRWWPTE